MPNIANTAASRPRLNLQPRDSNGDGATDDAWVIIVHEEDKGLGRFGFQNDVTWDGELANTGVFCGDPDVDLTDNCIEADIGKNQLYISFAMGTPQTSVSEPDFGMVANLVAQHNQYNAPEVNWITGTFYPPNSTADMWDFNRDATSTVDLNYLIFNTEIARRASLMTQSLAKAKTSKNGLVAMPLFKEGTINQGGPADIMARRFVVPVVADQCNIFVDPNGPYFTRAFVRYDSNLRLRMEGSGLDGDLIGTKRMIVRNPVTGATIVIAGRQDEPDFALAKIIWGEDEVLQDSEVPCSVQAADYGPANWGENWGPIFPVSNAPAGCSGPLPPACTEGGGTVVSVDEAIENPYDFGNMACQWYDGVGGVFEGTWLFADGSNPYYPKGLCTAPTINLSARTPLTCEVSGDSDGLCAGAADMSCANDMRFGQLCSTTTNPEDNKLLDKLVTWYECPGSNGMVGGTAGVTMPACFTLPDSLLLASNLDDRSWYMPTDIAKAHRGFLDGDFVAMIYAWSPNWKLNAVGHDRYELFVRRSFDGGKTWTVLPATFTASNGVTYGAEGGLPGGLGTVTCETWRDGDGALTDSHVCTQYPAGAPEQSRNVSQHKSMKITTLDPRYTPTIAEMPTQGDIEWALFEPIAPTDLRDPSRFFVVFESGDNTTVAVGEAEPLNLDYGRAEKFGDHYTVWSEIDTGLSSSVSDCYPSNAHGTTDVDWAANTGFCNEFDGLEGFPDSLSEEASITSSAYGDFLYGVWGQFNVDANGVFIDSDAMFRRVWYLDDYISPSNAYTLPGTQQQVQ